MTDVAVARPPKAAGPFSTVERMIAWRYLRSRRKEAFISVIAAITDTNAFLRRERR